MRSLRVRARLRRVALAAVLVGWSGIPLPRSRQYTLRGRLRPARRNPRPDPVNCQAGYKSEQTPTYEPPSRSQKNIGPADEGYDAWKRVEPHAEGTVDLRPVLAKILEGENLADELDQDARGQE